MEKIHAIQLQILEKLLFSDSLKFNELRPNGEIENNLYVYHLDQLIKVGFIEKVNTQYLLTTRGKEYAGRINSQTSSVTKQGKISVRLCCTRVHRGKKQFLLYTRLKQQFYGCQQMISGKVEFGEKITECAARELKEEAGLSGIAKIVDLKHFVTFDKQTQELITDSYLFLCVVRNPKGVLNSDNREGKYEWVNKEDLDKYLTNPLEDLETYKKTLDKGDKFKGKVDIEEVHFYTEKF